MGYAITTSTQDLMASSARSCWLLVVILHLSVVLARTTMIFRWTEKALLIRLAVEDTEFGSCWEPC